MALIDTPIYAGEGFFNLVDEKTKLVPVDKETLKFKNFDNIFVIRRYN